MSSKYQFKLELTRYKEIPLDKYGKNFVFIVNEKRYQTCRLVADLLSPTICQLHYSDPTINEFHINTRNVGNFQHILNLTNFDNNIISESEIPFINETLKILNNNSIQIHIPEESLTTSNAFELLKKHQLYGQFYSPQLQKDIEFISTHFCELNITEQNEISDIDISILEKIISNEKLKLDSEDQLLLFINKLYSNNPRFFYLYQYVNFLNVSTAAIKDFLNIFDCNHINQEIWEKISIRLQQEISTQSVGNNGRYTEPKLSLLYEQNKEFQGIINYIQTHGNINNGIVITSSQLFSNEQSDSPRHAIMYNDNSKYFRSKNVENAFICFDFKDKRIIPLNYTIKTASNNSIRPKHWVIEASDDNDNWTIIDRQDNCEYMNDFNRTKTFSINNSQNVKYRYIRMRQTAPNWYDKNRCNILVIGSIEFYGYLI